MSEETFFCYFFILLDVRNQLDFIISFTIMADPRLRWSAMRSCYKRYKSSNGNTPKKDYFSIFETGYEHFIELDKGHHTKTSALEHINYLTEIWYNKNKDTPTTYSTGLITFH